MKRRVVVTGIGALTPIGNNVNDTWKGILNHQCGIDFMKEILTTDRLNAVTEFNRENALLAKDIATLCQFIGTDKRKHFTNQEVDVFVASSCIFFGKGMGTEEGGDYIDTFMLGVVQATHYL